MEKYDIIFCVVTYKNYNDIADFLKNLHKDNRLNFNFKVIIVNNFADDESLKKIKRIALENNCDFIENENKGYSHGNNLGIEFAKNNYKFDYLVVCNPDTIIKQFNFNNIKEYNKCIIAPEIICLNSKKQNPMYFRYMPISEKIVYYGFLNRSKYLLLFGVLLNKINRYISRMFMKFLKKRQRKIYACHGSFIIFSNYAIEKLYPVFDNNMFLFCEENDLAQKAKKNGIDIIYIDDIIVIHKENGSMNFSNNNLNEIQRESYLYYYRKWNTI